MWRNSRQIVAVLLFLYGCLTTALALGVYAWLVWYGENLLEDVDLQVYAWLSGLHLFTFVVTFSTDPFAEYDPRWKPLFPLTPRAILVGRLILVAATINFAAWITAIFLTHDPRCAIPAIIGLFLISSSYTAVHWAIRPENLFSWQVLGIVRQGLLPIVVWILKKCSLLPRSARRRRWGVRRGSGDQRGLD